MTKTGMAFAAAFLLITAGCSTGGRHKMHSDEGMKHSAGGMMQKMDANGDGVISKDEFMKAHEMMFERMKNRDGVIDMKDMPKHH
jgi:hypothetical protein